MHGAPQQPRKRAVEPEPAEIGDGSAATDRGHSAEVAVAERPRRGLSGQPGRLMNEPLFSGSGLVFGLSSRFQGMLLGLIQVGCFARSRGGGATAGSSRFHASGIVPGRALARSEFHARIPDSLADPGV